MKKAQTHEIILGKAEEYARTGQYSGGLAIDVQLRHEGWKEARRLLDDE